MNNTNQASPKLFTEQQVSDVWDNAYYRASYDIHKPPTDPPLTKELYINTLHPVTSHSEGDPWISVKDRLPEDREELVITTVIRNKDGKRFVVLDRRKTFNDYVWDTVTHWMPLPPPAK